MNACFRQLISSIPLTGMLPMMVSRSFGTKLLETNGMLYMESSRLLLLSTIFLMAT